MDNAEFLLGTVTAVSTSAGIKIQLDGQDAAMSKYYKILITGAEVPVIGERVAVMKHSGTYVVIGKIGMPSDNTGKVNRSGDTMTGNLTLDSGKELHVKAAFKSNDTYASNQYGQQILLLDSAGSSIGYLRNVHYSGGNETLDLIQRRTVNGESVYNSLQLVIGANGARAVIVTDPAAWRSALNALNKSGDTMTGTLIIRDANLNMDDPNFTVGTRPSTNQLSKPFRIRDADSKTLGRIQGFYGTDGTCGLQLYADQLVNGEDKYNFLALNIGETGVASVNMNHPEAWRLALGLGTNGVFPITVAQGGTGNTGTATVTTLANIATASTGVTLLDATFSNWGKLAMLYVHGKTTAAIADNAVLFTVVSGKRPVSRASAQIGRSPSHCATIGTDGTAVLGGSISSGTEFSCVSTYLLP